MKRNGILLLILCVSLFASVTNFIPVSVSYCLLILFVPVICSRIPKKSVFWSLLCLYIFFLVSSLIYHPESLLNVSFYRRDGNFFITFLPLLILSQQRIWFNTEKIVRRFIYFATAVNLLCMVLPRIGFNPYDLITIETATINHFLFLTHNAAGGFIAVVLAFNVGYFLSGRTEQTRKSMLICCLINLIALVDSGSRGTLIAFAISAVLFVVLYKDLSERRRSRPIDQILFLIVLILNVMIVTVVADERLYNFVLNALHISSRSFAIGARTKNLWPKAIRLFSASPIVGTGYGSFNDDPILLKVIVKGLLAMNQPAEYIYSAAHAHNTYLHVMAETGIIGLLLLLIFLKCLRDHVMTIRNRPLRYGLYIGLCMNIFSSFTEHRLFTPSQMIPYVLILGMIISEERSEKFWKNMRGESL